MTSSFLLIFYSWLPSLIEGRNTGVEHGGIISCLRCREERGAACVRTPCGNKEESKHTCGWGFGNHQGFVCYHLQLRNYVLMGNHVFCLANVEALNVLLCSTIGAKVFLALQR